VNTNRDKILMNWMA